MFSWNKLIYIFSHGPHFAGMSSRYASCIIQHWASFSNPWALFSNPAMMADPRISETGGGAPTPDLRAKTYYLERFFSENCMEMKEIGWIEKGERVPSTPLGSANDKDWQKEILILTTLMIWQVLGGGICRHPNSHRWKVLTHGHTDRHIYS